MRKFRSRKKQYPKKRRRKPREGEGEVFRVRTPRGDEVLGRVEMLHGGMRMTVKCADNKIRMCRVPGKLKRIWVRTDDIVLVKPWPLEGEKKGDIAWRYRRPEVEWLNANGYLKNI